MVPAVYTFTMVVLVPLFYNLHLQFNQLYHDQSITIEGDPRSQGIPFAYVRAARACAARVRGLVNARSPRRYAAIMFLGYMGISTLVQYQALHAQVGVAGMVARAMKCII